MEMDAKVWASVQALPSPHDKASCAMLKECVLMTPNRRLAGTGTSALSRLSSEMLVCAYLEAMAQKNLLVRSATADV